MIKLACYIVLFLNAIYFLWAFNQPEKLESEEASRLPSIKLVSEIKLGQQQKHKAADAFVAIEQSKIDVEKDESEFSNSPQDSSLGEPQYSNDFHSSELDNSAESIQSTLSPQSIEQDELSVGETKIDTPALQEQQDELDAAPVKETSVARFCYFLGPFLTTGTAESTYLQYLSDSIQEHENVVRPYEAPKGYWVLYPPLDSYEAAEAKTTELKQRGIKEIWLFRDGPRRGSISLGLFKSISRAESQAKQLEAKGVETDIQRWTETQSRHWINFVSTLELEELKSQLTNDLPTDFEWTLEQSEQCPDNLSFSG